MVPVSMATNAVTDDLHNGSFDQVNFKLDNMYGVPRSEDLSLLSQVTGWAYFVAWTAAFYPQIIANFQRRSVAGLHLDFVALNFTGHITYAIFNSGLFWNGNLQAEYFRVHPGGVIPVQLNDVLFSLHAAFAVAVWIIQALYYESEGQHVSMVCIGILLTIGAYMFTCFMLTILGAISWLIFVYYFSYVKLLTAVTKYSPQVYLHYKRKTTTGFSMGGVVLDMTGGALSIIQMFLIAYNYSDWGSIVGDPTKLGLGLIAITYNIIFVIQNYVLYKEDQYDPIEEAKPIIFSSIEIARTNGVHK